MDTNSRRDRILTALKSAVAPTSASVLAEQFQVSRQIIVSDVALLRAAGHKIVATPRGYVFQPAERNHPYEGVLACVHTPGQLQDELYTIVDFGGIVIDVTIEHPLYGQLSGMLNLASRYDVDAFIEKVNQTENAKPLSLLTGGIHLHKIGCKDENMFRRIQDALREKGLIL